jgi:hypothetical protein
MDYCCRISPAWMGMIPTKSAREGEEKLAHRGINTSTSRRVGKNVASPRDEPFFSHLIKSTF